MKNFSEGEKRRPEMRLLFAGYISDFHLLFSAGRPRWDPAGGEQLSYRFQRHVIGGFEIDTRLNTAQNHAVRRRTTS